MRTSYLLTAILLVGCNKATPTVTDPNHVRTNVELLNLQAKLAGVQTTVAEGGTRIEDKLEDNTTILREIRDAVVPQVVVDPPERLAEETAAVDAFLEEVADDKTDAEDDPVALGTRKPETPKPVPSATVVTSNPWESLEVVPTRDAYVVKFTRSNPPCGPCNHWDTYVKPILEAEGVRVEVIDVSNPKNAAVVKKYGVTAYPTLYLCRASTKKLLDSTQYEYVGATELLSLIDNLLSTKVTSYPQRVSNPTYIPLDLTYSTPTQQPKLTIPNSTGPHWTYNGEGSLVQHLIDTHGYNSSQLNGLSYQECSRLHDAAHNAETGTRKTWSSPVRRTRKSSRR